MTLDPDTTVRQLITALPSTEAILQSYGLSAQRMIDEPLWRALTDRGVNVEEFLNALDAIDWSAEFPIRPR